MLKIVIERPSTTHTVKQNILVKAFTDTSGERSLSS